MLAGASIGTGGVGATGGGGLPHAASATNKSCFTAWRIAYDRADERRLRGAVRGRDGFREKFRLFCALPHPIPDDALATLADALADETGVLGGTPGWDEDDRGVAAWARDALGRAGARVEHVVAGKLDSPSAFGRTNAARVLAELPALSPATIDALLRHAADPEMQSAVGSALRGKLDARPLLDVAETRKTGFFATPNLEPRWLVELLGEPALRAEVLLRIAKLDPPPHDIAPAIVPYLADPDPEVVHCAIAALGGLSPDDASLTAAMLAASRRLDASWLVFPALARRSPTCLRTHVAELLAWFRTEDRVAEVLGALGAAAPPEVALALGERVASGLGTAYACHGALKALRQLGPAARPAVPALEATSQHPYESVREAAAELAAKLRT